MGKILEFREKGKSLRGNIITSLFWNIAGAKVVCEVSQVELRGKKIKVFHKIRRKGFDKLVGSRQHFTEVLVKEIVA